MINTPKSGTAAQEGQDTVSVSPWIYYLSVSSNCIFCIRRLSESWVCLLSVCPERIIWVCSRVCSISAHECTRSVHPLNAWRVGSRYVAKERRLKISSVSVIWVVLRNVMELVSLSSVLYLSPLFHLCCNQLLSSRQRYSVDFFSSIDVYLTVILRSWDLYLNIWYTESMIPIAEW